MLMRVKTAKVTSGKLRHQIAFREPNTTQAGDGQEVEAPYSFAYAMAEVVAVGGGEKVRGVQMEAGVDTLVTTRFRTGIDPTMTILHDGRTLNIVRASDPDGRRTMLVIQCKEQVT